MERLYATAGRKSRAVIIVRVRTRRIRVFGGVVVVIGDVFDLLFTVCKVLRGEGRHGMEIDGRKITCGNARRHEHLTAPDDR